MRISYWSSDVCSSDLLQGSDLTGDIMTIETLSTCKSFEGVQGVYRHASGQTGTEMTFAVFVPPHANGTKLPVLWYLSGLTCTHANVMEKGEYRRIAEELGMIDGKSGG